jgi:hypothetical protein
MSLIKITPETFATEYQRDENGTILLDADGNPIYDDRLVLSDFKPYRLYDFENQQNENRKEILLVDRDYLNQITKEFEQLIRDLDV